MEYVFSDRISALQPSAIREILKATADPAIIPFAAGNPDVAAFPVDDVRRISAKIFENEPITALQYGVTEGYEPLRKNRCRLYEEKNNIGRDFDKLIITSELLRVMDLATKSLCNFGDIIVCENPSFIGSLNCFRSYGCKLKGVLVEEDGMDMNALKRFLKRIRTCALFTPYPISKIRPAELCRSKKERPCMNLPKIRRVNFRGQPIRRFACVGQKKCTYRQEYG